jgi:hypothetical protein
MLLIFIFNEHVFLTQHPVIESSVSEDMDNLKHQPEAILEDHEQKSSWFFSSCLGSAVQ